MLFEVVNYDLMELAEPPDDLDADVQRILKYSSSNVPPEEPPPAD